MTRLRGHIGFYNEILSKHYGMEEMEGNGRRRQKDGEERKGFDAVTRIGKPNLDPQLHDFCLMFILSDYTSFKK